MSRVSKTLVSDGCDWGFERECLRHVRTLNSAEFHCAGIRNHVEKEIFSAGCAKIHSTTDMWFVNRLILCIVEETSKRFLLSSYKSYLYWFLLFLENIRVRGSETYIVISTLHRNKWLKRSIPIPFFS